MRPQFATGERISLAPRAATRVNGVGVHVLQERGGYLPELCAMGQFLFIQAGLKD